MFWNNFLVVKYCQCDHVTDILRRQVAFFFFLCENVDIAPLVVFE